MGGALAVLETPLADATAEAYRARFLAKVEALTGILTIQITTREEYETAARAVADARTAKAEIEEAMKDAIAVRLAEHRVLTGLRANLCAIPDQVIGTTTPKLGKWDDDQEAARVKAQAALDAAAAAIAPAAQDAALDLAIDLEAKGDHAAAEAVVTSAAAATLPAIMPAIPSSAPALGTGRGKTYSAELEEGGLLLLAKAVAAGTVPVDALEPCMTFLNGRARKQKKAGPMDGTPGVKVIESRHYGRPSGGGRFAGGFVNGAAVDELDR